MPGQGLSSLLSLFLWFSWQCINLALTVLDNDITRHIVCIYVDCKLFLSTTTTTTDHAGWQAGRTQWPTLAWLSLRRFGCPFGLIMNSAAESDEKFHTMQILCAYSMVRKNVLAATESPPPYITARALIGLAASSRGLLLLLSCQPSGVAIRTLRYGLLSTDSVTPIPDPETAQPRLSSEIPKARRIRCAHLLPHLT